MVQIDQPFFFKYSFVIDTKYLKKIVWWSKSVLYSYTCYNFKINIKCKVIELKCMYNNLNQVLVSQLIVGSQENIL